MEGIQKGIYEHYKGKRYELIDIAYHSESQEAMVVYKMLYASDFPVGTWWVRPLSMFTEDVLVDGRKTPRFRYIGPCGADH